MGKIRTALDICSSMPKRKRPLEKPKRRWENNIKIYLKECGFDSTD
jgi:hypothetical protein